MLPFLNAESENSKKYTIAFRGLNYGEDWVDGELSDCKNLSSAKFPCLSQSFERIVEKTYEDGCSTLFVKDGLIEVIGRNLYHEGNEIGQLNSGARKKMAAVGNYVVIFPDKMVYNVETGELTKMEQRVSAQGAVFTDSTLTSASGGFGVFKVGDGLTIEGCDEFPENNKTVIVRAVTDTELTFYENTFTACTPEGSVRVSRKVPALDHICESNYRLWGTSGNTIYGSKYGDPFNFEVFDGLSGDSYTIEVATEGSFTGCIAYNSHICFFKQNTLHKLYGNKPSNFQLVTSQVPGVFPTCERSMCIVNDTLYYVGANGVYAYTGSVPELISGKLGSSTPVISACGASDGERYYISGVTEIGDSIKGALFVYDLRRDIWLKEDNIGCKDMAYFENCVRLITTDNELLVIAPGRDNSDVEWSATFCPFHETVNERKGYSKFHMRLELDAGAWLAVEIKRDTDDKWEEVYQTHNERARTLSIPIVPARCDSVEIRLKGKGKCLVRTFIREFFVGSDV